MKQHLLTFAKLLVSLLLVGLLLHAVDPAPVFARMGRVNFPGISAVLALALLETIIIGWRWQLIGRLCGAELPFRESQELTFIGCFFNQTLPSTIGGDVVRVFLSGRAGIPIPRATVTVLADRVMALLALILLSAITLPLFFAIIHSHALRGALLLVAAGGIGGFAACLALGEWFASFIPFRHIREFFTAFTRDMRHILPPGGREWLILGLSVLNHVLTVIIALMLARMMGIPLGFLEALVLIPPVILLTVLPVSLAGWGIREGAMVVILAEVGVAAADALALSLAFGLVFALAGLPGGVVWLFKKGKTPHAET